MPVRSLGTLLAGGAVLFALSVAGPGCQSSSTCTNCCSSPGDGWSSAHVGMAPRAENTVIARTQFPIMSRHSTAEPIMAQDGYNRPGGVTPAAVILRPVPMGRPAPTGDDASRWAPVQRVGEGASNYNPIRPVATIERPLPSGTPVGSGGPLLPVPALSAPGFPVTEPGSRTGDRKDSGRDGDELPPPRVVSSPKRVVGNGYPDLPNALVTQPVDAPREFGMRALSTYIVEPPDILIVEVESRDVFESGVGRVRAEQLVRPDGTIGFSTYPPIFVAGLTLGQVKVRLAETIFPRVQKKTLTMDQLLDKIKVDVLRYNSKHYYVITDGGGYGEQVIRLPLTGNERVLDAIAQIQGLPAVASKKKIWIARATPNDHTPPMILPVDWCGITQKGFAATNYQMFPGDRLYVNSDPLIRTDSFLAKALAPVERLLGVTLLGSSTVNSIRNRNGGSGSGNNSVLK